MIERPVVFYNKGQQINGVLHSPTDSDTPVSGSRVSFTGSPERRSNRTGYLLKQRVNSPIWGSTHSASISEVLVTAKVTFRR